MMFLAWAGWVWLLACKSTGSSVSPWLYLASSNSLALLLGHNLHSPQLVQEALEAFNIGPFQADGELLCMWFLQPSDDPPSADGVGSRPWEAFRRVLEDLGEHTDQTQSVIPSEQWKQWFLGLDEKSSLFSIGCCRLGTQPLANHGKGHLWKALLHFHAQRVWLGTS